MTPPATQKQPDALDDIGLGAIRPLRHRCARVIPVERASA
jgi:hypothetical protein